jgi:hypothetical protein
MKSSQENNGDFKLSALVDNTGSMGQSCTAARESYNQINSIHKLLFNKPFELSVYGDYDAATPDNTVGGYSVLNNNETQENINKWMSKYMKPCGGGGAPEAIKTALNFIINNNDKVTNKILFIFTDAPPHDTLRCDNEGKKEIEFLKKNNMIGVWSKIAEKIKENNFTVVTFLTGRDENLLRTVYEKLGHVVTIKGNLSYNIAESMIQTFFKLIGQPSETLDKNINSIESVCNIELSSKLRLSDPEYVLETFDYLLNKDVPMQSLCLMTNPVLGKFWRLICGKYKFIENEKYAHKCQELADKLGYCKDRLPTEYKEKMKKWLDDSHNDTEVIRSIITKAFEKEKSNRYLVLPEELRNKISLDDVLDLGRNGNYSETSKLIANIKLELSENMILPEDYETSPNFIPLAGLNNMDIFRLIGNLLFPGVLFSQNVGLFCAMLSTKNKYLAKYAHELLESKKGQWINWQLDEEKSHKMPVFWTLNILRLLNSCPDYLTETELKFVHHYLSVTNMSRNTNALLEITVPNQINNPKKNKTYKKICVSCNYPRCFTLFPKDDECAFCIYKKTDASYVIPEEAGDEISWAQCSCGVLYGILKINDLGVKPKCHYCRNLQPVPQVSCSCCKHKYVSPNNSAKKILKNMIEKYKDDETKFNKLYNIIEKDEFLCTFCLDNENSNIRDIEVKINDFIEINPELKKCVPFKYEMLTDKNTKLWKRVLALETEGQQTMSEIEENHKQIINLKYNNMTVHNQDKVFEQFIDKLMNHDGKFSCMLCADDVRVDLTVDACGNCPMKICKTCSDNWYNEVKPGKIASFANTVCPFCKSNPKHKLVRNLCLGQVRNIRPDKSGKRILCEWNKDKIYALCMSCVKIEEAMDRECAALTAPDINNFICEPCHEIERTKRPVGSVSTGSNNIPDILTKECPQCTTIVQKIGGCNHITCKCGSHWCWSCGTDKDENGEIIGQDKIYDHLSKCNGIFSNDAFDGGEDAYDEYEYESDY